MEDTSKNIENTTLWNDVKKIISSKTINVEYDLTALIHTEKEDFTVLKLTNLDIVRDYSGSIADQIYIETRIPLGDYVKRLHPYRNNLELSIKKIPKSGKDKTKLVKRYKAIFLEEENPKVAGTDYTRFSHEQLNNTEILTVKFQLLELTIEVTRILTVSGVFRNFKQEDLIRTVLFNHSNQITINGKPVVDGVDIVKLDNTVPVKQVIIPDGTTITTIPTFLQEKVGGIYNSGIGTYFQVYKDKKMWFVYPVAKTDRFNEPVDKVIFYSVPNGRLKSIEKTYRIENTVTYIVVTGGKSYRDSAELSYMNEGVGFRTTDARAFMKKPVIMTEDGPKGLRSNLNTEVIAKERSDNLNFAPMVGKSNPNRGITINQFLEASIVNIRKLARVDVVWENGNIDLLYPGMPCKYIFLEVNKIIELNGTVVAAHSTTAVMGNQVTSDKYKTSITVTLAVETYEEKPNVSKLKAAGRF